MIEDDLKPRTVEQAGEIQKATIAADIEKTAGQRRVNIIWEGTQAMIALSVTLSTLFVAYKMAFGTGTGSEALSLLRDGFFIVVGFYFGRTNHQRVGGVGGGTDSGR